MGWDGIDEYAAKAHGWKIVVLSELHVLHYKTRGSAQPWVRARWEEGRGAYYMGYRLRAVALRSGYRMLVEHPPVLGGVVLALGFCAGALAKGPQADPVARGQLRREQRGMLLDRLRANRRPLAPPKGGPAFWTSSDGTTTQLRSDH